MLGYLSVMVATKGLVKILVGIPGQDVRDLLRRPSYSGVAEGRAFIVRASERLVK